MYILAQVCQHVSLYGFTGHRNHYFEGASQKPATEHALDVEYAMFRALDNAGRINFCRFTMAVGLTNIFPLLVLARK